MLERIRLQNFKTHRDTDIKLGRLTVLVGPNGSGKSSVLQAIELLAAHPAPYIPSDKLQVVKTRPGDSQVGACSVELRLSSPPDITPPISWTLRVSEQPTTPPRAEPAQPRRSPAQIDRAAEQLRWSREQLQVLLLAPDPRRLAEPVPVSTVSPTLHNDGFGLADVVALMRLENENDFQALQIALRAVVPQIERIWIKRTNIRTLRPVARSGHDGPIVDHEYDQQLGHEISFDVSGRKGIPASMMSGGTLLTLGILALLYSQLRPRILLIDDIDHGLHPRAQWDLLKQLRRLLEQFPELQLIATSHSPDLVDELAPDEVVVTALREDGTSAAKSLAECPRSDLLGVLKSGQLWSAIGEDWVKDPAEHGT